MFRYQIEVQYVEEGYLKRLYASKRDANIHTDIQISVGVIHLDVQHRWITPSLLCVILHITHSLFQKKYVK